MMMRDMARRGSMQHVNFMDFSFFPTSEAAATATLNETPKLLPTVDAAPSSSSSTTVKMSMSAANQNEQQIALCNYQEQQIQIQQHQKRIQQMNLQLQQMQMPILQVAPTTVFDFDHRSAGSNPSSEPSVAAVSLDSSSSDHSVSSKSVVHSSESSADGQRFKPFHEEKWTHRYRELLEFRKEHGHSAVPHTYPKNPQLARWIKRQRRQHKLRQDGQTSTMTLERLDLLNSVDFIWDSHDLNWREKLEALTAFRAEMGHSNVPSNFRDKKLSTWVKCQRRQYKLFWDSKPSAMSLERIAALEKVGFEWEIRSTGTKTSKAGSKTTKAASVVPEEEEPLPANTPSSLEMGDHLLNAFFDVC